MHELSLTVDLLCLKTATQKIQKHVYVVYFRVPFSVRIFFSRRLLFYSAIQHSVCQAITINIVSISSSSMS